MLKIRLAAAAVVALAAAGPALALPVPSLDYEFSGNFSDGKGGSAITGNGGAFTGTGLAGGLSFGRNEGPTLGDMPNAINYSIEMFFSIADVTGYRKLIDFKNRGNDGGVYNNSGVLQFVGAGGSGGRITANTPTHLVLTRDATTRLVTAFVNGSSAFSFVDSQSAAVFTNDFAHFFRDDLGSGGGSEASAGFVDFIRIYANALTGSDVAGLYNGGALVRFSDAPPPAQVPEPAAFALFAAGLLGLGCVARTQAGFRLRPSGR